jgi:osmotically-inducible protein OsmY
MHPTQPPSENPDEIFRCQERKQMMIHAKNLSPIQKTDEAIKDSIYHAIWKDAVLRTMEYDEIDLYVKDGIVSLYGHIINTASQNRIRTAIRSVPDVLGIRNNLVLDEKLTLEVAASLGSLEQVYDCKFFTGASHGVVSLNGVVRNEKIKLLAEKVAASNQNVRGVLNNIRASGTRGILQDQPFLQPAIGEIIYFLDGISGVVKRVIINPNNRRVIAMIVQGQFTDPRFEHHPLTHGKAQLPEQLVSVRMNAVRYLTKVSGFLNLKSCERNLYLDFDPGQFDVPDNNWVPPYPYCSENVLFPIEYRKANVEIDDTPDPFPFGAILEDASIREQFFATDSIGL